MGKIRMTQKLVPRAASMEEIPRRAISEDVSKPRPKRIPRGYIFHGLLESACWIHIVGKICLPVNKLEHLPKNIEHDSSTLNLPSLILLTSGKVQDLLHLSVQLVQDVRIHKTQEDQKRRTDRGANNATNSAEAVEARRDRCCSGGHDDRGDDDNPVLISNAVRPNSIGLLTSNVPRRKRYPR